MGIDALNGRLVERAGQVIDDGVEQRLNALVLECRSADDRENLQIDGGLANAGLQLFHRWRLAFEKLLQQHIVGLGDDFNQLQPEGLGLLLQIGGNRLDRKLGAQRLVVPENRLHLDQIDDALEVRLGADGNLQRHGPRAQPLADGLENMLEIRAVLVHLVDEANPRNLVLVALPPHGLGLRLHAADGIKQRHRAVEHAQAALHFGGKVHVAGGINNIDADVAPDAGGRRRGNRDAALLLLLHVIHGRRAFMHLSQPVRDAGIKQDALCRCRLSGVDMRHDPDVPAAI